MAVKVEAREGEGSTGWRRVEVATTLGVHLSTRPVLLHALLSFALLNCVDLKMNIPKKGNPR